MKLFRRLIALLLLLTMLPVIPLAMAESGTVANMTPATATDVEPAADESAQADTVTYEPAPFKGWSKKTKYQYVTFGSYPQQNADTK